MDSFLHESFLHSQNLQKENKNIKVEKILKILTLALGSPLDALYVALQEIFIDAEGYRVLDESGHEIWDQDLIKVPRICGGSAALLWLLATRFGAWPLLVRPRGILLLEV